jgi:hypothetical protein
MDADNASVDIPDRARPQVEKDGTVKRSVSFVSYRDPLEYVLVAGRTILSKVERQ